MVGQQLNGFSSRLGEALLHLSEQTVRPNEATLSFNAFKHIKANGAIFRRAVSDRLSDLLSQEIRLFEMPDKSERRDNDLDLSLVTFDEMENKVLLGNISQSLELDITEVLSALNLRIARVIGREEIGVAENPFRPQIFVQAIYQGWCRIDPVIESHRVVLRMLGPELFLQMSSILKALNETLVEQGILPDLTDAYRRKKAQNKIGLPPSKATGHDELRYNKVRNWLLSTKNGKTASAGSHGGEDLDIPDLFAPDAEGAGWNTNTISVKVGPRLFGYLNSLQKQIDQIEAGGKSSGVPQSATILRQVKGQVPEGTLTQIDENTIELLAKIFDYVFLEKDIPPDMKRLIGQLQIPLLKAALIDKKFFIKDDHPARRLIDALASSGVAWDQEKGHDDPLYKMIEQIVARVQKEFDQQVGLFADVVANLESFLAAEDKLSESILAEPIAEAVRQEKIQQARKAAERDIALRIETGEVAGFVEIFLEEQWARILTLAYSVELQKPEVLAKALSVMDDLIWSLKPKNSPEQRKELITKLPSILSLVNAWLNAIKWNEPERVIFFSNLAERHAAIVRVQSELSSRYQIEMAVNIAEKASEHRLNKHARARQEKPRDRFAQLIDTIGEGNWIDFVRNNGSTTKFKLTWISPLRSRFIFTDRQGRDSFSFTADELAQTLREGKASVVMMESVVDRALSAALGDVRY